MSTEVGITALNPIALPVDGKAGFLSEISYTKDWIEKALEQNQDVLVEGRLILGCSWDAHGWILKAVGYAQNEGHEVFITDDDDIFARPELLLEVIFKYWDEWHAEDPRWSWSQETIIDFLNHYKWAVIYIDVC